MQKAQVQLIRLMTADWWIISSTCALPAMVSQNVCCEKDLKGVSNLCPASFTYMKVTEYQKLLPIQHCHITYITKMKSTAGLLHYCTGVANETVNICCSLWAKTSRHNCPTCFSFNRQGTDISLTGITNHHRLFQRIWYLVFFWGIWI